MLINVFIVMMLFYQRKIILSNKCLSILSFFFFSIRWKIAGNVPGVELRLSDKRLFHIINHIQSIPFPESKHPTDETSPIEPEVCYCYCCYFFFSCNFILIRQPLLNHYLVILSKHMKQLKE